MADKEFRVGAMEHHHLDTAILLDFSAEAVELLDKRQVEKVDRG